MPWPTNIDYQEAIQAPALCFDDLELKTGTVEMTRLGLPRPFAGNFASVYKIKCLTRTYAVRCFLRDFADQAERYQEISNHLRAIKLPCMVDFEFIPKGIRVKGQWYPILKMEWVQGELLINFVKRGLGSPATCLDLARKWLDLCRALKTAGVAHGDFQHGNIVIVSGQFRLIDYDGMFVPSLANRESHEVGHPNYQHPNRISGHFGPYLDNFSAWVIYISLVALSVDPTLWQTTKAGDECLLFRQEDFQNPDTSSAFAELETHPNIQIQSLALMFKSLVFLEPARIPSLDGQMSSLHAPTPTTGGWLLDHVPAITQTKGAPMTEQRMDTYDATWILDFTTTEITQLATLPFSASLNEIRLLVFGSLAAILGLGITLIQLPQYSYPIVSHVAWFLLFGVLLPVNVLRLRSQYKSDPAVKMRAQFQSSVYQERSGAEEQKKALAALQQKRQVLRNEESEKRADLQRQIDGERLIETRDVNAIQVQLGRAISDIVRNRQKMENERDAALATNRANCQREMKRVEDGIASGPLVESQELAETLVRLQDQHIQDYLHRQKTCDADVKGLTHKTRVNLITSFPTAADVDYLNMLSVDGIKHHRASLFVAWRERHEARAKKTMLRSLPSMTEAAIKSRYAQKRQQLQQERLQWQSRLQSETDSIKRQAEAKLVIFHQNQQTAQTKANQQTQLIKTQSSDKINALVQNQLDIAKDYATKYAELDGDIRERSNDVCQHNWRLATANREFSRYSSVTVTTMLKRIFFMR